MMKMKKNRMVLVLILMAVLASGAMAESFTVASFSDPSQDSSNPLFTVDWNEQTVSGNWLASGLNLRLGSALGGTVFENASFEMDDVAITDTFIIGGRTYGETGAGQVIFYEDGSNDELLVFDFGSAVVSRYFMGADDFVAGNVQISGPAVPFTLSSEEFSFSFANVAGLDGGDIHEDGFTATASFTSSAIPEPTTLAIFATATVIFGLKRTKNKQKQSNFAD